MNCTICFWIPILLKVVQWCTAAHLLPASATFLATSQVGPSSIAEQNGAKMRRHQHKGNNHCSSLYWDIIEDLEIPRWGSLPDIKPGFDDLCQHCQQCQKKTFKNLSRLCQVSYYLVNSHFIKADAWEATVSAMSEMIWYYQLLKCMNHRQAGDYVTNQTDRVCSNFGNA